MFLRGTIRRKNGKEHRYWSIVENKRIAGGKVRQRHVLYLGEIKMRRRSVLGANRSRCWTSKPIGREHSHYFLRIVVTACCRIPRLSSCDCRNCAYAAPGNGGRVGWRSSCGKSCNWESSGGGVSLPAARVRVGTTFSSFW